MVGNKPRVLHQTRIKAGDVVRVTDPRRIIKIGYDHDVDHFIDEVEDDPDIIKFLQDQHIDQRGRDRVVRAIASSRMARSRRQGSERRVFHGEVEEWMEGRVFNVSSRFVRWIGRYDKGYWSGSGYGEWDDYDPPALVSRQALIVLGLDGVGLLTSDDHDPSYPSDYELGMYVLESQVELA